MTQVTQSRSWFVNSSLVSFEMPSHLQNFDYNALVGMSSINMDVLELPDTLTRISSIGAYGYIGMIVINSELTTFVPGYNFCRSISGSNRCTWVIKADSVVPIDGNNLANNEYYVPDALVDAYKAATNWSTVTARIHPISELPN